MNYQKVFLEREVIIDCSNHTASNENLAKINEWFQKNKADALEFTFEKKGPDHQPLFECSTTWQKKTYKASAPLKKDAEKKVRSYIWDSYFTKKPSSNQAYIPDKPLEGVIAASYENFRQALPRNRSVSAKPVLFIDLTSTDAGDLTDADMERYCHENFSRIILFTTGRELGWDKVITLTIKEERAEVIKECMNRVLYYMIDHVMETKIVVFTMKEFPKLVNGAGLMGQKVAVVSGPDGLYANNL